MSIAYRAAWFLCKFINDRNALFCLWLIGPRGERQ
jgi:hypothetical protein